MVSVFGNDFDVVADAEIALQRFCESDAPVPEFLVTDHLDLERVLDFFENRCRGSCDDEIVIVDDGGEDVG